ncbi:hypothetical protein ACN47E_001611 [Coniothyrium glycines]
MSSPRHDLEEPPVAAADDPVIPVSATPPRRDPVEDADASFTRKRPRLDSGGGSLRAMSANPETPSKVSPSPYDKQLEMTIRALPASSPLAADGEDDATFRDIPDSPTPVKLSSPILIAEGEAASPRVMLIADEDNDTSHFAIVPDADEHYRRFPFAHAGHYSSMVRDLSQHIRTATVISPNLLPTLVQWLLDLPDPSADVQGFYTSKAVFWDDFSVLADRVVQRRFQWLSAVANGSDNDVHRFPLGQDIDDRRTDEAFCDFLGAYMRVCSFLMLADVHLLSGPSSGGLFLLPLLSVKHIRHIFTVLRQEKTPLLHMMRKDYAENSEDVSNRLHRSFLQANGAQNLLRLVDDAFHRVPVNLQNLLGSFASQLFSALGWAVFELTPETCHIDQTEYYRGVLLFFRKYSGDLLDLSRMTDSDSARDLVLFFSTLLAELCRWDNTIAEELVNELSDFHNPDSPTTSPTIALPEDMNAVDFREDPSAFPALVANAWKLKILRKYVIKGNMGMRVMSMVTMDAALVEIWREYSNIDPTCKHPVMQCLADFLIHGQVVEYIISVDSHPQLIARSGNIVGFLVVTHRWSDKQADAIWNTVSESPDPGVVTATMTMLRSIIGLMSPADQLYLCQKLYELPIQRYTLDILRVLRDLSGRLTDRAPQIDLAMRGRNAQPWMVCIRMILDTAPGDSEAQYMPNLHGEATEQLRSMTHMIPDEERYNIYCEAAQQISDGTDKATGSVRVFHTLAVAGHAGDLEFFQQRNDLIRQILVELPRFVQKTTTDGSAQSSMLALQYRLELVAFLVCRVSPALPLDLFETIWYYTIGEGARSKDARDLAWSHYLQTIKVLPENEFCRQLVFSYVATIDPQLYTIGLFNFIANYNFPSIRHRVITERGEEDLLTVPGAELLWSMIIKAPHGTIEDRAARLLAARFVQITDVEGVTIAEVEDAHVALVDRCMTEIGSAFNALRSSRVHVDSQHESNAAALNESHPKSLEYEARLGRLLLFQKLLLEYIRQKPELNRSRRADSKVDEADMPSGITLTIKYQCGNERQSLVIPAANTLDDLYRRLCHATGYTKVNLFAKGQRFSIADRGHEKIRDVDFGGQLLIQRAEGAEVTRALTLPNTGCSSFETAVMKHFDELFTMMDSDDATSQMIYDFLSALPSHKTFADGILSGEAQTESLFPPGKFFQARYVAQALQAKLGEQIRTSTLDESFLTSTIRHLDQALLNPQLLPDPISSFQELRLAAVLVSALLDFLRERFTPDVSATYFSNGLELSNRLINILSVALETNEDAAVVQDIYAVILEASLHSQGVWEAFIQNSRTPQLHHVLLLTDSRTAVREHIAKKIASVCGGDLPSTCPLTKAVIASQFWTLISGLISSAARYAGQSHELFEIAEHVFRVNDEYDRSENVLRTQLYLWSDMLLSHKYEGQVGREEVDHVVLGFTKLLLRCILSIKSFKKSVDASDLMEKVFKKFLFPNGTVPGVKHNILPVLESSTRHELYELMLAMVDDRRTYETLVQLTGSIENDDYEPQLSSISVDRSSEIRSSTGYVGLYNPRAICYMNSLLTQLFMNVEFRQFILSLEIQEARGAQKLLSETQRLFANMQNSYRRATDPRDFAACVKSLDQTQIDVGVQMDVDEFYNLLFDQWEAQLVKDEHKERFRSFYGGKTLNQIKSKECDHVSERTEPFFAIQCDVMGKVNLQESLQAFVRGDVMEGDNKYKCESCGGKFVDAVKRTCFKDVPDNLIFHLKRFEFDLNDFSRRKINDYFEFPVSIDINAYHVDYLSDPCGPSQEDIFDLVGVLVHTGTCENGHYYSYIRQRPSSTGSTTPSWIEFDDSNVGPFDPYEIASRAFGGPSDEGFGRQMKPYSAYMLFYQRRTSIENDKHNWPTSTKAGPVQVALPNDLQQDIEDANRVMIEEYARFDPNHSRFVRQLHAACRTVNQGTCSDDHEQENNALRVVLSHLSQISWRHQTSDTFLETIVQLRRSALSCSMCCNAVLKTFSADDFPLLNPLVRCMHPKIRSHTRALVVDCLKFMRDREPVLYGMDPNHNDTEVEHIEIIDGMLNVVVAKLRKTAEETWMSTRGWDDFYLALHQIIEMGLPEAAVVLNHGFLEFCAKLFAMGAVQRFRDDHYDLGRIMTGKRTGFFNRLISCLAALLSRTDGHLTPVASGHACRQTTLDGEDMKFPLTKREMYILFVWDSDLKALAVLDKILETFDQSKSDHFYPGDIVRWMLESPDAGVQTNIFRSIFEGVALDVPFCDNYILAALPFCEACPVPEHIPKVITAVAKTIASASHTDEDRLPSGNALLGFFSGILKAENEYLFEQKHPHVFTQLLMLRTRIFAVPLLLHSNENIQRNTQTFLTTLYTDCEDAPPETMHLKWKTLRELVLEIMNRIVYEKDAGIVRAHLNPLIRTGQTMLGLLYDLSQNEDPEVEHYKDVHDTTLFYQWRTEIEPRLRTWTQDLGTPLSTAEHFDQSDYGIESRTSSSTSPAVAFGQNKTFPATKKITNLEEGVWLKFGKPLWNAYSPHSVPRSTDHP